MKYVQLLYHYQINSLNLFVKDITAFIEIHQFICFLQAFKQWGIYRDGWNNFPINFTNFCVGTSCGEYSFDNRDNWIRFDAGLSGFRAQKMHDIYTAYIAIGV